MAPYRTLSACLLVALLVSCTKNAKEVAEELLPIPSGCGQDGARVQATLEGSSFCANAQVLAVSDGASLMITGLSMLGTSLMLQVDSIAVGSQPIGAGGNDMLLLQTGTAYVPAPGQPGTLVVTLADTTAHRFTASYDITLRNEDNASTRQVQGTVDVTWTDGD